MVSLQWQFADPTQNFLQRVLSGFFVVVCVWLFPGASHGIALDEPSTVEFDDGNFLVDTEAPLGMIAVELHSPRSVGGETTLMLSGEAKASFADDGQPPDREAKDGFYSGFVPGNVKEEILRYESAVETLSKDFFVPIFRGYELLGTRPSSEFIRKWEGGRLPILLSGGRPEGIQSGRSAGTLVEIENSIAITDLGVINHPDYVYNFTDYSGNAFSRFRGIRLSRH
jgi:hypothetical protein